MPKTKEKFKQALDDPRFHTSQLDEGINIEMPSVDLSSAIQGAKNLALPELDDTKAKVFAEALKSMEDAHRHPESQPERDLPLFDPRMMLNPRKVLGKGAELGVRSFLAPEGLEFVPGANMFAEGQGYYDDLAKYLDVPSEVVKGGALAAEGAWNTPGKALGSIITSPLKGIEGAEAFRLLLRRALGLAEEAEGASEAGKAEEFKDIMRELGEEKTQETAGSGVAQTISGKEEEDEKEKKKKAKEKKKE